ncbi:MAG: hypothetical protein P1U56_20620 [Saprospiraceae bacterium]|nr:hypothetical protein [Saprospiraceae bacterium]
MKRRTFLTAAGTVGIIGAASATTVVSSVYKNLGSNALLAELDTPAQKAIDKFLNDIKENSTDLGLDANLANNLAMPVQIIRQEKKHVAYKNRAGNEVSITFENGVGKLRIK